MVSPAALSARDNLLGDLCELLRAQGSVLVALSGGIDSSVVAAAAHRALGAQALAVTGVSASLPGPDLAAATALCRELGMAHETVGTEELSRPGYVTNTPDRCYWCKRELYDRLAELARARGLARIVDGTNVEDLGGHRPGHRAAQEHRVISPLVELGAGKADVRALARLLNLPDADRPASPCLSSRVAYGVSVTPERLQRVGHAEAALRALGFANVRVRLHDHIARIEVPKAQLARACAQAEEIRTALLALGFVYVTLDLGGLRSGSQLEILGQP